RLARTLGSRGWRVDRDTGGALVVRTGRAGDTAAVVEVGDDDSVRVVYTLDAYRPAIERTIGKVVAYGRPKPAPVVDAPTEPPPRADDMCRACGELREPERRTKEGRARFKYCLGCAPRCRTCNDLVPSF